MQIFLVLLFWPKWKPEPSSGNWLINKLILPPLLQILPYTGVGEGSSTPSALPFFLPGPIKQQLTDKVGLPKAILRSTPSHSIYGILFPGWEKSLLGFRTQIHKSKNLQMQQKILEGHTFKQYLFRLFLSISSDLSSGELKALDYKDKFSFVHFCGEKLSKPEKVWEIECKPVPSSLPPPPIKQQQQPADRLGGRLGRSLPTPADSMEPTIKLQCGAEISRGSAIL